MVQKYEQRIKELNQKLRKNNNDLEQLKFENEKLNKNLEEEKKITLNLVPENNKIIFELELAKEEIKIQKEELQKLNEELLKTKEDLQKSEEEFQFEIENKLVLERSKSQELVEKLKKDLLYYNSIEKVNQFFLKTIYFFLKYLFSFYHYYLIFYIIKFLMKRYLKMKKAKKLMIYLKNIN